MIEHHIDLPARDGAMNTFVTHPEEGGPFPVVLFYMDAPGKREELHDMARRLATVGYYVVLPNLYYRWTREFDLITGTSGETRTRMFELMHSLSDDMVASDTEALFAHIDADPRADASRVGCVGYCMSGPFVFAMACTFPDRIRAAASVYGVRLFGEGSPAPLAPKATGELYFACAEFDEYAPLDMVDALEQHLIACGANARVERYPGAHHGFAFPLRPVYDKAAAERHWERLFALFDRTLRDGALASV
ncbi:MAG: dienelactone hydrolase family protein [Actinobacteria bacterium]|nr:dienelactone hydrolase family protein [Actinomycetota bacterium]